MRTRRPIRSRARLAILLSLLCCASTKSQDRDQEQDRRVISGQVLDPHRLLPDTAVLLLRARDGESVGSTAVTVEKDGSFVTAPVPPGTYVLEIARARYPSQEFNRIIGQEIVRVGETDLSGVTIVVRRDTAITGRFVMESDDPQAKWPPHIVVNAVLALDGMPLWHGAMADGASGGTFVLRNAFGPRVVRCGYQLERGGAPWWPSKVTLDGVDITNVPTDFSLHEGGRLEVAFTQKPARIAGAVTDARGLPVSAWIVVNAADRELWQRWSTTSEVTRGNAGGRFALVVPPGSYRVHALPDTAFDSVKAARKAALQFASDGIPVSLDEQERKEVTLTVR